MKINTGILEYKLCIECKTGLVKNHGHYCKICKPKQIDKKLKPIEKNKKIYSYEFKNKKEVFKASRVVLSSISFKKENSLYILDYKPKGSLIQSNINNIQLPIWDQFKNLKEISNYLIISDNLNFSYFITNCTHQIRSIPKFYHDLRDLDYELPEECDFSKLILPVPVARAIHIIYQQDFWDTLIDAYFHEFHPLLPTFSIKSFDIKTVSPTLLSAIYFCGFQYQTEQPKEVVEYMNTYSEKNIKKVTKRVSMSNARALVIYAFFKNLMGDVSMAKYCLGHLNHMSFALGLHLEYKQLSPIEQYNRKLLFSKIKVVNDNVNGSHKLTPLCIKEYGDFDLSIYDPKWQTPDDNCIINFPNAEENLVYAVCTTNYNKFVHVYVQLAWSPFFDTNDTLSFMDQWQKSMDYFTDLFNETIESYGALKSKYPRSIPKIMAFEFQIQLIYHQRMVDMYAILKRKLTKLTAKQHASILEHLEILFEHIIACPIYHPLVHYFAFLTGLHYLNIFPKSTIAQKKEIKMKLTRLISYINKRFLLRFSLNYLILKLGLNLISIN
ncbi:hypothetical protein CONCODRAFT_7296 [Conidiobolus coronatus NRRL 28638]|uniref:Xylanolytic transcriptional activator regulatory domain-containing protein n=1 Tax=Conidiobolus coronatus (strain ATCC 28846 / CBS 209.66 / NRRL 28638) TaxID=796925 RepID=A0A137P569_CONC2|nr:hypothetical protein CONCODRAFT_7296 [Conidiobolus coronatus NRRL 28638]|eukprot:KXN70156.1 hypothetical protein CONCODRAFT_7296 [Conidiobolus coronatus NRRL 28638]